MTKLGLMERKEFIKIFDQDFFAIQSAFSKQIQNIWDMARKEVLKKKGLDIKIERKEEIEKQIEELNEELHKIERNIRPENLTKQQIIELGGSIDRWGQAQGGKFYGIPVKSLLEYEIIQLIKDNIDLEAPAKFVFDLHRACSRELTMAGTFEDAQEVYNKFYALDFRKYGIDIPPRLTEIKKQNPLLEPQHESLKIEHQAKIKE